MAFSRPIAGLSKSKQDGQIFINHGKPAARYFPMRGRKSQTKKAAGGGNWSFWKQLTAIMMDNAFKIHH